MSYSSVVFAVGTLQIGDVKVEQDQVVIPVVLGGDVGGSGTAGVASMNFRLRYNADMLTPMSISAGSSASGAQKQVMGSAKDGEYIVVMMGMNQTVCGAGEVARIVMKGSGSSNAWDLSIADPCLSTPDGKVLECEAIPYDGKADEEPSDTNDGGNKPVVPPSKPDKPSSGGSDAADRTPETPGQVDSRVPGTARTMPVAVEQERGKIAAALQNVEQTRQRIMTPGTGTASETMAGDGESDTLVSGTEPATGDNPPERIEKPESDMLALVHNNEAPGIRSSPRPGAAIPVQPNTEKTNGGKAGLATIAALTAIAVFVLGALLFWRRRSVG
jgi:hypothetical protein